jgi:NAD(P)-dependent dehydrogenase (short-subunit alcohol dehydrogenase family)
LPDERTRARASLVAFPALCKVAPADDLVVEGRRGGRSARDRDGELAGRAADRSSQAMPSGIPSISRTHPTMPNWQPEVFEMMPSAVFPDLENASVLITGGGSGIGAKLTEGFVRQRAKVAFVDIAEAQSRALCEDVERTVGRRPLFLEADLRDVGALRAACAEAAARHGPVTVLVNNAARDDRHAAEDVTPESWDANQAINIRPQFFAAQAVIPGMQKAGRGAIVNFTSISFMMNNGDMPAYTAAKAAVIGLTKGLAGRYGKDGIRVNAIAPGWVITERQQALWVREDKLAAHIAEQAIPRKMVAEDIVGPCLFLASDASAMLTAQTLIVDGGYF